MAQYKLWAGDVLKMFIDVQTSKELMPTDTDKMMTYETFTFYVQVMPSKKQYESNIFDKVQVQMKSFMGDCHEDMMVDLHRRSRLNGESKLKFQVQTTSLNLKVLNF